MAAVDQVDDDGIIAGRPRSVARVLAEFAELAAALEGDRAARARRDLLARTLTLPPGPWLEADWPPVQRQGAGLLVLDGLMLRRVGIDQRHGAELLAAGDLLRPWQREDSVASIARESAWRVLRRTRLAVLDLGFLRRAAPYPEVVAALIERTLRRSRSLAVNMAIVHQPRVETRLLMILWHLADRWGRVGPDGVSVPVRLTHAMLADLVAAQRPTVSAALSNLQRDGLVSRAPDGWHLHGLPPGELTAVIAADD